MKLIDKDRCLVMAAYQYKCQNQKLMWQWLCEWATWGEDMGCHVDARMPVFKPRKARKRWKNLTNADTHAIIKQIPNWTTDHLNTFIFKVLVEEKFKEKNA